MEKHFEKYNAACKCWVVVLRLWDSKQGGKGDNFFFFFFGTGA
jgi:hypothetical protein